MELNALLWELVVRLKPLRAVASMKYSRLLILAAAVSPEEEREPLLLIWVAALLPTRLQKEDFGDLLEELAAEARPLRRAALMLGRAGRMLANGIRESLRAVCVGRL